MEKLIDVVAVVGIGICFFLTYITMELINIVDELKKMNGDKK